MQRAKHLGRLPEIRLDRVQLGGLLVTLVMAWVIVVSPLLAVAAIVALALVAAVWSRPSFAAYLLMGLTPLLAGIDRGTILPYVRPHEVLVVLLGGVLLVRAVVRGSPARAPDRTGFQHIDLWILLMAISSSIAPLLSMLVRRRDITLDDILYSLTLWKFYALYLIIRMSVRTERSVDRCLWISMAAAAVVAAVAVLQLLKLFGVPAFLATYYPPSVDTAEHVTSTLSSPFSVAHVLTFNLAITAGFLSRGHKRTPLLVALSILFVFGIVSTAKLSAAIALAVGAVAIGLVTRRLRQGILLVFPSLLAIRAVQPLLEDRFDPSASGRLENLRVHFWPELFSDFNYLLGVRPSARIPVNDSWRDYIWIESGHTWLLWNGGIPLLVTFFVFVWAALRNTWRIATRRVDAIGTAAIASFVSVVVMATLMISDVMLTARGAGDLLFSLLALALTVPASDATRDPR